MTVTLLLDPKVQTKYSEENVYIQIIPKNGSTQIAVHLTEKLGYRSYQHIDGFYLFDIENNGLNFIGNVNTCDETIEEIETDEDTEILKVIGWDIVI